MLFRSPKDRHLRVPSLLLLAAVLASAAVPAGASAAPSAQAAYHRADRSVVHAATRLARCQRRSSAPTKRCKPLSSALQRAGLKLSAAQRRLPRAAAHIATARTMRLKAPAVTVSGTTLSWTQVADVTTYILVTKVPGQADRYSVVNGTSTTPAAVAGATVSYNVRTAVTGSAWSNTVTVAYPAPAPDLTTARQGAPVMSVSGQTISWNKVADVDRYVFVTKISGQADKYEYVTGTSYTPPTHPGLTVHYGLSTDVQGARWATEVTITYPASTTTTTSTGTTSTTSSTPPSVAGDTSSTTSTSTSTSTSTARPFQMGIVSGSAILWQQPFVQLLGAKHVRMEFDIDTPVSTMAPIIASYAKAGIQPLLLAGFSGRTPTDAEAANLATWAAAFGPNGTARGADWAAGTAVTAIEFGNESNQPWQYPSLATDSNWPTSSTYANIATQYALKFKEAKQAISAANSGVGLLAIADTPGRWATWMNGLFNAVPDFGKYVSGWTVHPYGPDTAWQLDIDDAMSKAAAHGAPSSLPIYVTEYGFATDNGRCLDDNYGWNPCMTYDQAATNLHNVVSGMRARYGSRLAAFYLYSTSDLAATGASTSRESYFGALRSDKSAKGAYTTEVKAELAAGA